jgi:TolA-binding protein
MTTNGFVNFLGGVISVALMTGCLQTRSAMQEQEEKQVLRSQVQNLQQSTADVGAQFNDINDEFRRQNGRIETVEARTQQMTTQMQNRDAMNEQRFKEINERLVAYHEAITRMDTQIVQMSQQMAQLQEELKRSRESAAKQKVAPAAPAKDKGNFTQAEEDFERKNWKDAILNYENYRKMNPTGRQYAVATYKIGVCFEELGMKDDAKAFYEEVLSKYPKSREASRATSRLRGLNKGAIMG